jgi:FPC/CPF motif-containing protein YcgG
MSNTAGTTTGWLKSLVDHTLPIIRKSTSSAAPGHVLAAGSFGFRARPRVRFFCMRESLAVKWKAAVIGLSLTRAMRWGWREEMREKAGVGREASRRIRSIRTPRNS